MPRARVDFRVVSRRDVLAGLAAATGAAACDNTSFPSPGGTGAGAEAAAPGEPIAPITANVDFYVTSCCGTNEYNLAISNAVWTGLPLRDIFESLGVTIPVTALELVFTSADGYSTSLPVSDIDKPLWLVWRMNGEPLPATHGYPARLLVPGRYGMKNPKWIVGITFTDTPYTGGHWESYGWSNEATYRPNALVREPGRRATVEVGPVLVQDMAFAGSDPIARVQVRFDGGDWTEATLDYAPGPDVWTLWHIDWDAPVGSMEVEVV
ncbi:MAG: molybdopterin-dependent oxidoreductase [Myxococcota bacterium]